MSFGADLVWKLYFPLIFLHWFQMPIRCLFGKAFVHLKSGLFVFDMGYRFGISQVMLKMCLCKHLQAGDNVMLSGGFKIKEILPPGVGLNIPPF